MNTISFSAMECDNDKVKCEDGIQCIYKSELCDIYTHCNDESDEDKHMCKGETLCVRFYFHLSKFRS